MNLSDGTLTTANLLNGTDNQFSGQGSTYTISVDPKTLVAAGSGEPLDGRKTLSANAQQFGETNDCSGSGNEVANYDELAKQATEDATCNNAAREEECRESFATGAKYNNNPCFSELAETSDDEEVRAKYNSIDCQSQRGKRDCEQKNMVQAGPEDPNRGGHVYVRAFGIDPENSCITFIGFSRTIINYAMLVAALIAGAMLLKGGFKYTVSRGNAAALIEARDEILHASIGLAMLASAYVAILFLQGSLGFLGLDLVGPFSAVFGG